MGGAKPVTQSSVLPSQDSAVGRGIKTSIQSIIGFLIGLIVVVWAVPGVPQAIINYTQQHLVEVLVLVGIPSGFTSFIWNLIFRKDVETY